MRVVALASAVMALLVSPPALSQGARPHAYEGIAGPPGLRGFMPMSEAMLDVPNLEPGAQYWQEMLLTCIGPDVLLGLDERSRAFAAASVSGTVEPAIVVDGAARHFEVHQAVNSEGGWAVVFHDTATFSANPPHWTDGIAAAQSLVLDLPEVRSISCR